MKKNAVLAVLALVASALTIVTGCEKAEERIELSAPENGVILTATLEQSAGEQDTKTALGNTVEGSTMLLWSNGDKIKVLSGASLTTTSVLVTNSDESNADFVKDSETPDNPDPVISSGYYGFFPAENFTSIVSDGIITANLMNQQYVENSFGRYDSPMVACTENGSSMAFKNVYGVLKLELTGTDVSVSAIRVTSNAGDFISGEATINYHGGAPTVEFSKSSQRSTSVSLNCNTAVPLSNVAKSFYIALPPTKSATVYGYKIEIITNDGRMMTKTMPSAVAKGNKIERSKILSMPPIAFVADPALSNSYIVSPGNTTGFTFNASYKGNSYDPANAINPVSAKLLWNTGDNDRNVITDVSLSNGFITVKTANVGNAVVAVYDGANGTGNILWSWHIWVTDYNTNDANNIDRYPDSQPNPNVIMMNRNLGALDNSPGTTGSLGLMYQWGRKDPFIGGRSFEVNELLSTVPEASSWPIVSIDSGPLENNTSLAYSIKNPMTFIYSTSGVYDWYALERSYQNDHLWNSETGGKTIYDPCPAGWRVPNGGPGIWNGWAASNFIWIGSSRGRAYNSTVWYPAAGVREHANGSLARVGESAYYLSSTPSGINMYILYFNQSNDWVLPSDHSNFRAYGGSVRCMKEQNQ